MHALIDGDILLYRCGYGAENESEEVAIHRLNNLISKILEETKATSHAIYLSDSRDATFRAKLNPEYKGNRKSAKPIHYQLLKDYLINEYFAQVEVEQEADDALGIAQTKDTIICSIDKDLLQVPGLHYNFVKEEHITISEEEGVLFFYLQLLMGDKADNVPGVTGIGIAKASNILQEYLGDDELTIFKVVQNEYRNWLQDFWADQGDWTELQEQYMNDMILLNGQMLKIRQTEGEMWQIPTGLTEE